MSASAEAERDTLRLTLRLTDIEDLFRAPTLSPFSADFAEHSLGPAMEYVASQLNMRPSARRVVLTLSVPAEQLAPDLAERTQAAIRRYCQARATELTLDLRALRVRSFRLLGVAFVALLVSVAVGRPLSDSNSMVLQILGDGLILGVWVLLWFPVDTLIFGERYQRVSAKVFQKLMDAEIVLLPHPEEPPAG